MDPCSNNPPLVCGSNGQCVNVGTEVSGKKCQCNAGYSGTTCGVRYLKKL